MSTAPDIFISYAHDDRDTAQRFADAFIAEGFDVWWDDACARAKCSTRRSKAPCARPRR